MRSLKNWQFACTFSVYVKVFARRVHCYFLYAKTEYAFTQFMYAIVVFINAHKLHLTLNTFLSFLFTLFYKILFNSFCQLVNNLYYIKHFVVHKYFIHILTTKAKLILQLCFTKTKWLVVRKQVDNLMFCSAEPEGTLKL